MGKATGFLEFKRSKPQSRPIDERLRDWREVYLLDPVQGVREQGARCMDCGIPFCHQGCPLGNLIPDWNDLASRDQWREAIDRLHATNNFPEWTGRLCPAPCEGSCVLGINDDPVAIKRIELSIIERAFLEGWIVPRPPARRTGKAVAVLHGGDEHAHRDGEDRGQEERKTKRNAPLYAKLRQRTIHHGLLTTQSFNQRMRELQILLECESTPPNGLGRSDQTNKV